MCTFARALLFLLAIVSCGAFAPILVGSRRPPTRTAAEPFASFHLLDRHLSALSRESASLRKAANSSLSANVKAEAGRMSHSIAAIDTLALRLKRRYRRKPFAVRLFGRLHARGIAVKSGLKTLRTANSPAQLAKASSVLDQRIVALSLQYNAITAGYAALQCAPGEWTCCEPRRQNKTSPPDACRWACTRQAPRCRGFVGARVSRK